MSSGIHLNVNLKKVFMTMTPVCPQIIFEIAFQMNLAFQSFFCKDKKKMHFICNSSSMILQYTVSRQSLFLIPFLIIAKVHWPLFAVFKKFDIKGRDYSSGSKSFLQIFVDTIVVSSLKYSITCFLRANSSQPTLLGW